MKKLLAILLTLSLALALAVPAFAVEDEETAETPAAVSEEEAAPEEQPVTISAPADADDEDGPTEEELAEMSDFDRGWYEGSEAGYAKGVEAGKADYDAGKDMAENEYPDMWDGDTYQEGYDNGYKSGYDSGYADGYAYQFTEGYNKGHDETYDEGFDAGRSDGMAGTPVDPWDSLPDISEFEDYSYEAGLSDGRSMGFAEGYYDGYWDVTGREYEADLAITAKGGVPGEVNVMFQGKMVQFPDQKPEIKDDRTMVPVRAVMESMGAKVDYNNSSKGVTITMNGAVTSFTVGSDSYRVTVDGKTTAEKMDCACYVTNDRTMVPVRFLAEASGYQVFWSEVFRTVVVVDVQGMAADIDENFTAINGLLAARLQDAQGKKQETSADFSLKLTVYDEDGKAITLPLSGKATSWTDGTAVKISLTVNAKEFLQTALTKNPEMLEGISVDLRTAMTMDPANLTATLLLDKEGKMYIQTPGLLGAMLSAPMKDNEWRCLLDLGEMGIDMTQIANGSMTVGSILMSALARDETAFVLQDTLDVALPMLETIFGDSSVQKDGDKCTWVIDLATLVSSIPMEDGGDILAELLGSVDCKITFSADPKGNYAINGSLKLEDEGASVLSGSLDASGNDQSGKLSLKLDVAELLGLDLSLNTATKTVMTLPELTLPKDAVVLEDDFDSFGDLDLSFEME